MSFIQDFKTNVKNGPITRSDFFAGIAGMFLGGPVGAVLSPVVYRGVQRRIAPWALTGTVAALPLSVVTVAMLSPFSPAPTTSSSSSSSPSTPAVVRPTVAAAPVAPKAPSVSFNRNTWSRVRSGMTQSQVEAIIGKGELLSKTSMMGTTTAMVQYGNYFTNYGTVTYSDGVVFALSSNF